MKYFLSTTLLCGMCVLGAAAQNASADYEFTANKCTSSVYSNGTNIGLTFSKDGERSEYVKFDLYQEAAYYLRPGTYTVSSATTPGSIANGDTEYTVYVLNGTEYDFTNGTLTVSMDANYSYTISGLLTLDDGKTLNFAYNGQLPCGPNLDFTADTMSYITTVNDPASNGFYYRLSDNAGNFEVRVNLFSDGTEPANGIYLIGSGTDNNTANTMVDMFNPFHENTKYAQGMVTVRGEGDNRTITVNGTLEYENAPLRITYTGPFPARPVAEPATDFSFNASACLASVRAEGNHSNVPMTFSSEANITQSLKLDLYQDNSYYLLPGTYTVGTTNTPGMIWGGQENSGYCSFTDNGTSYALESGEVKVALNDNVYTITGDVVLQGDKTLTFSYKGELACGPTITLNATKAEYVQVANPADNVYYYRLTDEGATFEATLRFYSAGGALVDEDYIIWNSTLDWSSQAQADVDMKSPIEVSTKVRSGKVIVGTEEENRTIKLNGKLEYEETPVIINFTGILPPKIEAGIDAVTSNTAANVSITDEYVKVSGLNAGAVVNIYNVTGAIVATGAADADGNAYIALEGLGNGVFVATMPGTTFKFVR
ncbi:MAG: hypothetical protein NC402_07115 [Prevotella sp.]|nr:hypothetical protein [Prevotella sp.]MCM1075151.1 hypothetical protein [Ruminococcus sp.]